PVELGTAGTIQHVTKVTDLYDPATNSWRSLADMNRFIHYHSVGMLLPDGRVIDTGGAGNTGVFGEDQRVEAFEPPYLFRGVRPRIDSLSTKDLAAGTTFSMQVSLTSAVTDVVMIGMRATTHWIDTGPNRYLSLDFKQTGSEVQATVPADQVKALSGWYLLLAVGDAFPSQAIVVRVTDPTDPRGASGAGALPVALLVSGISRAGGVAPSDFPAPGSPAPSVPLPGSLAAGDVLDTANPA